MREVQKKPETMAERIERVIDRGIGMFAPRTALRRRYARTMMALTGGYDGASTSRRGLKEWKPTGGSADSDINWDLDTLRARSRDLARNNPLAGGAIHTAVDNVVGPGIRPNARIDRDFLEMSDEEATAWEKQAERIYNTWAEKADLERSSSFEELQGIAFRSALESGDVVALLPWKVNAGDLLATKVQLVEGDRLSNPSGRADSATLSGGVDLDEAGAPVKYHIASFHPGDMKASPKREWQEYPAFTASGRRNVLHLFRKMRPGQHRGVPYLAPIIETLKQLGRYQEAEIMAAVISGMVTGFLESDTEENLDPTDALAADGQTASSDGDIKMGYGTIVSVGKRKMNFVNPGRPNPEFEHFIRATVEYVGMALELPYEVLIKHFTSSYSAARAALLTAWVFFKGRRAWLVEHFCEPVYAAVIEEAIARGYLAAPGFFDNQLIRRAYLRAEWIGPTPGQIDPVKEIQAAQQRMDANLTTHAEECLSLVGNDWEEKVPQMKRERELLGSQEPGVRSQEKSEEEKPDKEEEEE